MAQPRWGCQEKCVNLTQGRRSCLAPTLGSVTQRRWRSNPPPSSYSSASDRCWDIGLHDKTLFWLSFQSRIIYVDPKENIKMANPTGAKDTAFERSPKRPRAGFFNFQFPFRNLWR